MTVFSVFVLVVAALFVCLFVFSVLTFGCITKFDILFTDKQIYMLIDSQNY